MFFSTGTIPCLVFVHLLLWLEQELAVDTGVTPRSQIILVITSAQTKLQLLFRASDYLSQWENLPSVGKPAFSGLLYQSPPERPFPERKPSRFNTNSPLELNLIIALTSLYFFHFTTDLVRNSAMFPFSCKYLNTCTISLLLSSVSLFFLHFPAQDIYPKGIRTEQG